VKTRPAATADLEALLNLRNYYVANSVSTFDEAPLTHQTIGSWFATFSLHGPHRLFVAHDDEHLLGFCSSQAYRTHPAFACTVETSVYVAPQAGGSGVGSALYTSLFEALEQQGLHRALVGIALPNEASVRLHSKFGYKAVGVFNEYASKNGIFVSSQWMERPL
jgi:phosphinothricin acetyltransferase